MSGIVKAGGRSFGVVRPAVAIYSFRRAAENDLGVRDNDIIAYSALATPKLEAITTTLMSDHPGSTRAGAARSCSRRRAIRERSRLGTFTSPHRTTELRARVPIRPCTRKEHGGCLRPRKRAILGHRVVALCGATKAPPTSTEGHRDVWDPKHP
jgi:hypothetical protein